MIETLFIQVTSLKQNIIIATVEEFIHNQNIIIATAGEFIHNQNIPESSYIIKYPRILTVTIIYYEKKKHEQLFCMCQIHHIRLSLSP